MVCHHLAVNLQRTSPPGSRLVPRQTLTDQRALVPLLQVHVSTNQLINTARVLADPTQQHLLQALAPLQLSLLHPPQQQPLPDAAHNTDQAPTHRAPAAAAAAGPSTSSSQHQQQQAVQQPPPQQQLVQQQWQHLPPSEAILVGDKYYAAKEQLFLAEQAVLRLMRFELTVHQPHKYLLNFCRLLELQQQLAAAAVCVLNDAIAYTTLVCQHSAAVVAAAALQYVLQNPDTMQRAYSWDQSQDGEGRVGRGDGGGGGGSGVADRQDRRDRQEFLPDEQAYQRSSSHRHRSSYDDLDSRRGGSRKSGMSTEAMLGGAWIEAVGLSKSDVDAAQQVLNAFFSNCNATG